MALNFTRHLSIVLGGEAGQGIQTLEVLLTRLLKLEGYHVFAAKEYMSRVRGGSNSTEIRVSSERVRAWIDAIDLLIPLDPDALTHLKHRISSRTLILGDKQALGSSLDIIDLPWTRIAGELGNALYANLVAVGAVAGLFKIDTARLENFILGFFAKKAETVRRQNVQAALQGYALGEKLALERGLTIDIPRAPDVGGELLMNGSEAVALGALAGGCNFIASYPMSPATGVLTFMAQHAREFGVVVEQAEDEISAINMGLGAWYAGARAMVSTSGGGFALMTEGVSLAGMLESPMVIHLGQRPAPATGLPTRTEQADLELALYAGHGEFPRIILAPGSLEEAFQLSALAFQWADRFQVPVFILTDEFLLDSLYNLPELHPEGTEAQPGFIKTASGYNRYQLTADGLSPRGIPGWGDGLVCLDSDEHDAAGHITEDLTLRTAMVDKRLKKGGLIPPALPPPRLAGNPASGNLVVGWGSTAAAISEALQRLSRHDIAHLHFSALYPLASGSLDWLRQAQRVVVVENNATGQFARLLQLQAGITPPRSLLKYNGLPFSVEELAEQLPLSFEG